MEFLGLSKPNLNVLRLAIKPCEAIKSRTRLCDCEEELQPHSTFDPIPMILKAIPSMSHAAPNYCHEIFRPSMSMLSM